MDGARVMVRLPDEPRESVAGPRTAVHRCDRPARFRVVVRHGDSGKAADPHNWNGGVFCLNVRNLGVPSIMSEESSSSLVLRGL